MARLFGTDGVRGVANEELTPTLAMQLGQAGAYVLTKEKEHKPTIMVGCDTRISGAEAYGCPFEWGETDAPWIKFRLGHF